MVSSRSRTIYLILLCLICMFSSQAVAQGTLLPVQPGSSYEQILRLDPGSSYRVSLNLRANNANAIIYLTVEFLDKAGSQIGLAQVQRGLGESDRWYNIGIEINTPDDFSTAKLLISVDEDGQYWWDTLRISKVDTSVSGIRTLWEEKLATYGQVYTGLVIDARGLNLGRGMSPRIWSESGQLIYGGMSASYDYLQHVGLVSYGNELTNDLMQRIVVDPSYPLAVPLTIKALDIIEPARTSVVISDEGAEQIFNALEAYDFLARFSVIFLVD